MRFVYVSLSVLPTLAVVALTWLVVRAISVRVEWRKADSHRLDDKPA